MTFNYTHADDEVASSLVYEAYYNENTRELVVVLDSEDGYLYKGVPKHVFEELLTHDSAGRFYGKTIKRGYGPAERLGHVGLGNEDFFVYAYPAPSMAAVGTPKNLTYAPNAQVTTLRGDGSGEFSTASEVRVDLGLDPQPAEAASVQRAHEVFFEVDGLGNGLRTYNVITGSVGEAVDALSEATAALGINVTVKEVRVYFE